MNATSVISLKHRSTTLLWVPFLAMGILTPQLARADGRHGDDSFFRAPPSPARVERVPATPFSGEAIFREPPPAPHARVVRRPAPPAVGYVWVPGYYVPRASGYVWMEGGWHRPRHTRAIWCEPRWERRSTGYVFVDGYWQ